MKYSPENFTGYQEATSLTTEDIDWDNVEYVYSDDEYEDEHDEEEGDDESINTDEGDNGQCL